MLVRCEQDYVRELNKEVDMQMNQFEEACGGVQDPTLRYERFGIFPDRLTPLASMERDEDLKTLRQAVPALR